MCAEVFALLYRKIESYIREFLLAEHNKVLLVEGARQLAGACTCRNNIDSYWAESAEMGVPTGFFEEFLIANGCGQNVISTMYEHYKKRQPLDVDKKSPKAEGESASSITELEKSDFAHVEIEPPVQGLYGLGTFSKSCKVQRMQSCEEIQEALLKLVLGSGTGVDRGI